MERYISLYSTQGEVISRVRTELKTSDAKLKARLYAQLPEAKQNGVDLSGVDFTGQTLKNCRNCWFDNANLTGAILMNPAGSTFREATMVGTKLFGDCRDLYLDRAYMMGVDCSEAFGILVGGYTVNGDPVIANMRATGWWIHAAHNGVPRYFAFTETIGITYSISDPVFTARLTEMLGNMRERMASESQEIQRRFGTAGGSGGGSGSKSVIVDIGSGGVKPEKPKRDSEADEITRTLTGFMQQRSENSIADVPQLKPENPGDVLNQGN